MIKYVTSKPLWVNIVVAFGILLLAILLFMFLLKPITKHGQSKTVPSVMGKNINDVSNQLDQAGFDLVIQDSVFYDSLPPGVVIKQVPEADQVVKTNRTVYVVINRFVAPDISMPNIVGYSLRNAELTLQSLGLRRGDTTHQTNWAKGSVLEMQLAGKTLKPGDKIKVGSTIDLVIASGSAIEDMSVPDLVGLTLGEARILLDQKGIMLGVVIPEGMSKNDESYIYEQRPKPKTDDGATIRIRAGQMIDLFVQADPVNKDSLNRTQNPETP